MAEIKGGFGKFSGGRSINLEDAGLIIREIQSNYVISFLNSELDLFFLEKLREGQTETLTSNFIEPSTFDTKQLGLWWNLFADILQPWIKRAPKKCPKWWFESMANASLMRPKEKSFNSSWKPRFLVTTSQRELVQEEVRIISDEKQREEGRRPKRVKLRRGGLRGKVKALLCLSSPSLRPFSSLIR